MIVELIKLASLIITLNKSAACAGRVADILKVKSTMDYPSSSTYSAQISKDLATATADVSLSENAIVFNDVTFEYSKAGAPSLSHISFSVKKGQTLCIIEAMKLLTAILVALAIAAPTLKQWAAFQKRKAEMRKGGR